MKRSTSPAREKVNRASILPAVHFYGRRSSLSRQFHYWNSVVTNLPHPQTIYFCKQRLPFTVFENHAKVSFYIIWRAKRAFFIIMTPRFARLKLKNPRQVFKLCLCVHCVLQSLYRRIQEAEYNECLFMKRDFGRDIFLS